MANPNNVDADPMVPPRSAVSQLLGLYLIVSSALALSWCLGSWEFSCIWVFAMVFGLFLIWRVRLQKVVERNLEWHKEHFNRKRALRQEETAEWLNFIINRWWVFSSGSIENLVRRRINERLLTVTPSFLSSLELTVFTFGDITPNVCNVKVFECADGTPGFKPACWSSVLQPPQGLHKMSAYQVVLEASIASRCEDFRMVFRARVGTQKVGLSFDVAVEEMRVKGTIQVILHMSMEAPFPHVTKATISFKELPEVWFNVKVLKALQLMEVPLLKSWIHINVMEGITKALVDPGKIDVYISQVGPVNAQQFLSRTKQELAQGVLTVQINGVPSPTAGDDIYYTRLRMGKAKRQTSECSACIPWEDCCSFFVHDLNRQQLHIKSKCKRLLTTVTLEQHDLDLSSFPFKLTKTVNHEVVNNDGSKLNLHLDYTPLATIDLDEAEPVNILQKSGVLYVCVHGATNVIASDRTGSSDPYCVVFCDRRRVLTTPYVTQSRNPVWDSHTEFFVKDYSQCTLAFYVFDWDGSTQLDDDFLGSTSINMAQPSVLRKQLLLGYNKQGQGHVEDMSLGQISVSVVFRSVPSVEKSERLRLLSTDSQNNHLYVEDMVSPGAMPIVPSQLSAIDDYKVAPQMGLKDVPRRSGRKSQARKRAKSAAKRSAGSSKEGILNDNIFVDMTIIQGKDLVVKDRNGFSDPFCEVYVDKKKVFSTSVKKKTLSPMWNESVTFQLTEDSGPVEIELYDKDIIRHDFMGKVTLSLEQLKELSFKGFSDWYTISEAQSGSLLLSCTVTTKDTLARIIAELAKQKDDNDETSSENYESDRVEDKRKRRAEEHSDNRDWRRVEWQSIHQSAEQARTNAGIRRSRPGSFDLDSLAASPREFYRPTYSVETSSSTTSSRLLSGMSYQMAPSAASKTASGMSAGSCASLSPAGSVVNMPSTSTGLSKSRASSYVSLPSAGAGFSKPENKASGVGQTSDSNLAAKEEEEEEKRAAARSSRQSDQSKSSSRQSDQSKTTGLSGQDKITPDRMESLESDVFESPVTTPAGPGKQIASNGDLSQKIGPTNEVISKQTADLSFALTPLPKSPAKNEIRRNSLEMLSSIKTNDDSLVTSTPLRPEEKGKGIRRSESDIKLAPRSRRNSANSFSAFPSMDITTDETDPSNKGIVGTPNSPNDAVSGVRAHRRFLLRKWKKDHGSDKLYNVKGRVMSVHGLKINTGNIYCKVRALAPHRHRLKQIFGSRVIARSPMLRASEPVCNIPFDVDRGLGVSGETLLKFDVKCEEGKQHLASKAYSIKSLFHGPGGEGDKIQKVLPLENSLMVEVFLQHSPRTINRHSRFSSMRHDRP